MLFSEFLDIVSFDKEKPTYSREGSSVSGDEAGVEDHHLVVAVIDGRRLWS